MLKSPSDCQVEDALAAFLNGFARVETVLQCIWLPRGAPDGAPPCIRQRFLPCTAGDMQGLPERVLAPQRGLDSIGPVLRGWSPVIRVTCVLAEPEKARVHLKIGIGEFGSQMSGSVC
jgi:hypothetical protein